jgi:hypothetical protein
MPRAVVLPLVAIAAVLVIAAGGYLVIPDNPVFWCGRVEAYPGLYVIVAAVMVQAVLYIAGVAQLYVVTQWVAAPFVAVAVWQVGRSYPVTSVGFGLAGGLVFGLLRSRFGLGDLVGRVALALTAVIGVTAAVSQIALFWPGQMLTDGFLVACLAAGLGVGIWVGGTAPPGGDAAGSLLARWLPLSLLLLPVLRAKMADTAFDSFLYKATQPYAMAQWRTGRPAIMDAFMVGSNFQEVINTDLLILLRDYTPALVSTIAYLLLFFVLPLAVAPSGGRVVRGITALAGLSIFVLPEAAIDQGTAYQEPMMLLMLAAALAPTLAWPAFLAMAAGVKISAGFVAPLIALLHVTRERPFGFGWRPLLVGGVLATLVMAPQLGRNVALSGRVFGLNEALVAATDPPGPQRIMVSGSTKYDGGVRGGLVNNAALSACNMAMLGLLCPTAYQGSENAGFMMFPASRAPLFAVVLLILLFAGWGLAGAADRGRLAGSVVLFALCYALSMKYLSEGRYFLPLSFGFAVLLLINRAVLATLLEYGGRLWAGMLVGTALVMIGSELIPGVFANSGWACQRSFEGAVQAQPVVRPSTPVERFVAGYVARYKEVCPPPGVSPVLLAEPDQLNGPYLGAGVVSHFYSQEMNRRFYAADPGRQARLASAALVAVFRHDSARTAMLGPAEGDFRACFQGEGLTVLCSVRLRPAGPECARSLLPYLPRSGPNAAYTGPS